MPFFLLDGIHDSERTTKRNILAIIVILYKTAALTDGGFVLS